MATNKNITMKQFNGVDYDTLYPKTIASQVEGLPVDPMGEWIYCGRSFGAGKEYQISFNIENLGKTVDEVINQICLVVNSCDVKWKKIGEILTVDFGVGVTYKDGTQTPLTGSGALYEHLYWGTTNQDYLNLNLLDKIRNQKFLWNKIVKNPSYVSSGEIKSSTCYLYYLNNNQISSKELTVTTSKEIKSIDFYIFVLNGSAHAELSNVDFEVYIR